MNLYSVRDKLQEEFGYPFCAKNDGVAVRDTKAMLSRMSTAIQEDNELYCLGSIDTDTGIIVPEKKPRLIEVSLVSFPFVDKGGKK